MKKFAALLLALALMLSLVACGGEPADTNAAPSENASASTTEQPDSSQAEPAEEEKAITFTEMTAIDNEECMLKITGIEMEDTYEYALKALLENRSADKTYMFALDNVAVNGVQCHSLFASEVAAGMKANEEIRWSNSDLKKNGITEHTDIELTFRVYDSDD